LREQEGKTRIKDILDKTWEFSNNDIAKFKLASAISSDEALFEEIKNEKLEFFTFDTLGVNVVSLEKVMQEFIIEEEISPQIIVDETYFLENTVKKNILGKYVGRGQFKYGHIPSMKEVSIRKEMIND
jgi:spore coat polysaccharide biosynthesis predicted glycosyltransferase SpsG